MKRSVLALGIVCAMTGVGRAESVADVPAPETVSHAAPVAPGCATLHEFVATDCALTWNGITLYGAYDVGAGWVSHGLPENGYNYEGESLINRNGNRSQFLIAPNNLQQTGLGIKAKVEFLENWYVVFNAFFAVPARARSMKCPSTPTITSPSVSTFLPASPIPT